MAGENTVPPFRLSLDLERAQVERLRQVRSTRDAAAVREKLSALEHAAGGTENLMPFILAAAESYATVGEISDCLRKVFGEYRERS
jgi:methylmalonyl-CoA mutase N-terminal domain/subunit